MRLTKQVVWICRKVISTSPPAIAWPSGSSGQPWGYRQEGSQTKGLTHIMAKAWIISLAKLQWYCLAYHVETSLQTTCHIAGWSCLWKVIPLQVNPQAGAEWRQRVLELHESWAGQLYTRDRDITPVM